MKNPLINAINLIQENLPSLFYKSNFNERLSLALLRLIDAVKTNKNPNKLDIDLIEYNRPNSKELNNAIDILLEVCNNLLQPTLSLCPTVPHIQKRSNNGHGGSRKTSYL